ADGEEMVRREDQGLDETSHIADGFGERFGVAQQRGPSLEFTKRHQRSSQVEPNVDRQLVRLPALRQMVERPEGLLQIGESFSTYRPLPRLSPRLAAVTHRLLPRLAANAVMG